MQQIIELPLNGVTTTPSDYASPDGDLAFTSGVTNTKGSWQPLPYAKVKGQVLDGYELVYIHQTATYKCYILRKDGKLYYMREGDSGVAYGKVGYNASRRIYEDIVTPKDILVKTTKERILSITQRLEYANGDSSEANTKMNEFVTAVNNIFLPYLQAYDTKNSTNETAEWNSLSPIEKWKRIDNDYNREIIVGSLNNPDTLLVYCTVYPVWAAYPTEEGHVILKGFTQQQMGYENSNYNTLLEDLANNAIFYVEPIDNHDGEYNFIAGPTKQQYMNDVNNERKQLQRTVASFFTGDYSEDRIETPVPEEPSIGGAKIYYGSKIEIDSADQASTNIDNLCDQYYQYYAVADATTNRSAYEAELASLRSALVTYEAELADAITQYNENIHSESPFVLTESPLKCIASLGNVLTILTEEPVKHYIWQDGEYAEFYLPDDPHIQFGLKATYNITAVNGIQYSTTPNAGFGYETFISRKIVRTTTDAVAFDLDLPKTLSEYTYHKVRFDLGKLNIPKSIYIDPQEYGIEVSHDEGVLAYDLWHLRIKTTLTLKNSQSNIESYDYHTDDYVSLKGDYSVEFTVQDPHDIDKAFVEFAIMAEYIDHNTDADYAGYQPISINSGLGKYNASFSYVVRKGIESKSIFLIPNSYVPTLLTNVNTFIKDATTENKFIYPFFIRYGFELYDGTIVNLSAPVLMLPNTGNAPSVYIEDFDNTQGTTKDGFVSALVSDITFKITNAEKLNALKDAHAIVKNIVFAVTPQNYTYNQAFAEEGGEVLDIEHIEDFDTAEEKNWSYVTIEDSIYAEQSQNVGKYGSNSVYRAYNNSSQIARVVMPMFTDAEFRKNVENNSVFYIIKKIPVEELSNITTAIELEKGTLISLTSQSVLVESSTVRNGIIASSAMVYNGRLNLVGIKEVLVNDSNPVFMMGYSTGYTNNEIEKEPIYYRAVFHCSYNDSTVDVNVPYSSTDNNSPLCWLFSFLHATSADIYMKRGNYFAKATVLMKEHPFLNGYYALSNKFDGIEFTELDSAEAITELVNFNSSRAEDKVTLQYPNKLYTSNVQSPLSYDNANVLYVGNGTILALSTANRPISEGQFGQYPLYAFTTHGVWALEINADGTYSAPKPITRDVVTNVGSITQIDDAVVFVTERGLMLLSGGQSECLSDDIDETTTIHVPTSAITGSNIDVTINPKQLLQNCSIVYDYVNQRLICHSAVKKNGTRVHPYALVYSIKNKQWSYIVNDIAYSVSSYPETLVVDNNGNIRDMSNTDVADSTTAIIYTRPFRLTDVDYKSINEVRINGVINFEQVKVILQASNDLLQWQSVASSATNSIQNKAGTPYRFFRLLIYATLAPTHSLSSASIKFTPKDDSNIIGH